ncbi:CooT family nickel-binding protein [Photobacterium marinum]|uniref:CooT family nickel-binding protein n=1 Tax=Photobacterium marinum TaxID=1056511 RepID=UPI00055BCFC0|nr:CooT family nickel-binding protein [Photobacterium marinum]
MCNVKVILVSNGTKEIIENVTQLDFDLTEIVVTTFFEPIRVLRGFKPVVVDFLEGTVVLEEQ